MGNWNNVEKRRAYFRERGARRKEILVDMLGGSCFVCGTRIELHFHHVRPADKDFNISTKLPTRNWDQVVAEARKCVLLCPECHIDEHNPPDAPQW